MRKIFAGLILSLVLVTASQARATEPCEGGTNSITVFSDLAVANALRDYALPRYRNPSGDAIWLCFNSGGGAIPQVNSPLSLNNTSGLPVIISGLNIRGEDSLGTNPLLYLRGTSQVTLLHSSLTNCKNCLKISGNNNRVQSTTIQCSSRAIGIGALIFGNNHEIGSDIYVSQCQTGVQIGTPGISGTSGNDITIHDSILHDNGTAIAVARGQRNFFRTNSIYNNDRNGDSIFSGDEGILIANGANGSLGGVVINFSSLQQTVGNIRGVLRHGATEFNCESPPGNWSFTASFQLQVPDPNGSVEIFWATPPGIIGSPNPNLQQGRTFFKSVNCTAQASDGTTFADCPFTMDQNSMNKEAVILFHHANMGSSTFSSPLILLDPCWHGVVSAAELGAPGASGGGPTGPANIEYSAGVGSGSGSTGNAGTSSADSGGAGPSTLPPQSDDDNKMTASSGSEPTAVTAGAVTSGGLGGSGTSAGCGASLNPTPKFPQNAWRYIGILLPLAVLFGWRFKKKTL